MSRRLVLAILIAAAMVSGATRWLRGPVAFDDAYVSFRYAENLVHGLVHGHGLVFNPGERVEGYSNFLWVLLAATAIAAGTDPLVAMQWLGGSPISL
jgi:hypothetical protein